ncbi:MAG: hypothetical protein D6762_02545 [Candidatus Neomarinimicrobiota bacterium]|nr:MAG: hypothetical protein D6762_02545 [Candidatus Neomarinimicrobiota bacterium]
MKILWVLLYNVFLYPLMVLVAWCVSLVHPKLKKGMHGRWTSLKELRRCFREVRKGTTVYWFHAASFGEYEQIRPILQGLKEIEPQSKAVVSFFSPSGFEHVTDENIFCKIYLPFDFPWTVRKALKIVRPKKVVLASYDTWPNFIWGAHRRRIHTNIFAARFAANTRKLFPGLRSFYRSVYSSFDTIYTITKEDYLTVQKLLPSSAKTRVRVLGNPRYDQVKRKADQFTEKRTISVLLRDKRLIAGSTTQQDEAVVLEPLAEILQQNPALSVFWVPHEPNDKEIRRAQEFFRTAGIETQLLKSKKKFQLQNGAQVGIITVVGVLYRLYWMGQIAYIGGGFSTGVHNVMEPAIARLPTLFGPKYQHFPEAVDLVESGGGFPIRNATEFRDTFSRLLQDKNAFLKASFAATDVIHKNLGSSTRIVRSLLRD